MKGTVLKIIVSVGFLSGSAHAQFSLGAATVKGSPVTTPAAYPSIVGGTDDCNAAHAIIPDGPQADVPFTTGTTGTTGQNESNCLFFGTTGISNDVWFDWTATTTGNATITNCGTTAVDTKIAVYGLSVCPADGTALACNDDACALQTIVTLSVTAGTSYTFQLGTFPGAAGGSGTFDLTETPADCLEPWDGIYQWDDGTMESQETLPQGGELAWMVRFDTRDFGMDQDIIRQIGTAWGGQNGVGPANGTPASLYLWDDLDDDGDPRTGTVLLLAEMDTVVANVNTTIVNFTTLPQPTSVSRVFFVGVSINVFDSSETTPAPADHPGSSGSSWYTGNQNPDGFDPTDLTGPGSIGVYDSCDLGACIFWLTRAIGDANHVSIYCFGDGSAAPCPCGNLSDTTHVQGCQNSTGSGAALIFSGENSLVCDEYIAVGSNLVPQQPALLFAGLQALGGGSGIGFGDGLRCVGSGIVRLGVRTPGSNGRTLWGPGIRAQAGIQPGDTRYFQVWYRDPIGGPCGSGFNLSTAARVDY